MREALLSSLLLVTAASCATVPQTDVRRTANSQRSDSPFRVVAATTAIPTPAVTTATVRDQPSMEIGKVQLVASERNPFSEVSQAEWQSEQTQPPAPAAFAQPAPPSPMDYDSSGEDTSSGSAGTPYSTSSGLSLSEAIQRAMGANPTLPEAALSVRQMRAEWSQTGYYPNPLLYYVGSNLADNAGGGQHGVYLEQTIVTADKLNWNRAVASGAIAYANAQSEAQRLRVEVDTTILFFQALGTQRVVKIAEQILKNSERGLQATRDLENAGEAARADVLQADILYQQAQVALQQAEVNAEGAWRQLAAMMGRPDDLAMPLVGEFEMPAPTDFESMWLRLEASSPELHAASARIQRFRAKVGREEAQAVGDIDAQLSLQQDFFTNQPIGYVQIGIATPIHHRNEGAIASAQSQYIRACREYERQKLELRSRFAAVYQEAASARVAVERYREAVLPSAQENFDLTRSGYENGEFDLLRLLTAQRTFADTNTQYIQSQIQLRSAIARIDGLLLTGGLQEPPAANSVGGFGGLADTPRAE